MTASIPATRNIELDDESVATYLREHPGFFDLHPAVLAELELPHQSGTAVSLVERQVSVLRDRNIEMRNRQGKLIDTARENDRLFELTRRLILDLLLADSLEAATHALDKSLKTDFKTDFSNLCLLGTDACENEYFRCVTPVVARESVGNLLDAKQVICGILRKEETAFLFAEHAEQVKSAAVIPIGKDSIVGLLAVGNRNPQHYKSGMGTLFLSYIGDILAHALPRYL
ncbi:MAG: DUF484 family protein [Pseudomonadales bacterium]